MDESLQPCVVEIVEQGRAERIGEQDFVPLARLESGLRLGLDSRARWTADVGDGRLRGFDGPERGRFFEGIETQRDEFERLLAEGASACGLPPALVVASFPAVELVQAVLAAESPYYARLALLWLLPSELRPLRDAIVQLSQSRRVPQTVRDLALRLIVAE